MTNYQEFLKSKVNKNFDVGKIVQKEELPQILFPFQRDLVTWALRKGKAALFTTTGSGKTLMQISWASKLPGKTLIIAPLSVAFQTVEEAKNKLNIDISYLRFPKEPMPEITITNYEMVDKFKEIEFNNIVLDESSLLKGLDSKTRVKLIKQFSNVSYKLCCTATPAPNDITEILNHAEFLGIDKRVNILAKFFVHDDDGWRLKGHAEEAFYRWLSSWAMFLKKPSDLGYSDEGFELPPLNVKPVWLPANGVKNSFFNTKTSGGIRGRLKVRREAIDNKIDLVTEIVSDGKQWIVWTGLNDEGRKLYKRLNSQSSLMQGSDSIDKKIKDLTDFKNGKVDILITKPKIAGFGTNLQNCSKMLFFGLSDSFESFYQCIRRIWRYGQKEPVEIKVVLDKKENVVYQNVLRKEREAEKMSSKLIEYVKDFEKEELFDITETSSSYFNETIIIPNWLEA